MSLFRKALLCLGVAAVLPSTGSAAVTTKKSMWGPASVGGVSQFHVYEDLGVGVWQARLSWVAVATRRPDRPRDPADAAYAWPTDLDTAIADADRHGIGVSLLVMETPAWANGGRPPRWAPDRARDFANFMAAASRRYPAVRRWMIWGEPTKAANFQPLPKRTGRVLRGRALRGPRKYARMLDAAYGALKSVDQRDLVIGGNTFTTGSVRPRQWIRALRLPDGRSPRMDLYGHNPFSARPPLLIDDPLGNGYADFGDLDTLMRWLDRYLRGARPDGKRLRLFLSEYTLPTDHANFEFNFWVTPEIQARWIGDALRETRRTRRIATFGYLALHDDPARPDGQQVERGLIRRDGTRKPAYSAFRDG
jgi:hypothetical protein